MKDDSLIARRAVLKKGAALLASVGTFQILLSSTPAQARLADRSDLNYQDHPKDGKTCSNCTAFIPAAAHCRIVEGEVNPKGWCMAYSERK